MTSLYPIDLSIFFKKERKVCVTVVGVLVLSQYGVVPNLIKIRRTSFSARFVPPPAAAEPAASCRRMLGSGTSALRCGWRARPPATLDIKNGEEAANRKHKPLRTQNGERRWVALFSNQDFQRIGFRHLYSLPLPRG